MLDRGTASFTLATAAVGLAALGVVQWLIFFPELPALVTGPVVAVGLAAGVWVALRSICTGAGRFPDGAALGGILLLCAWSFFGFSFGGTVAIPSALLLMVAYAVVPRPR